MKLTKPQLALLCEIIKKPTRIGIGDHDAAMCLLALGLVRWGGFYKTELHPTAAGRTLTTAEETRLDQRGFKQDGGMWEPI